MTLRFILIVFALAVASPAFAQTPVTSQALSAAGDPEPASSQVATYLIGPADTLAITVADEPELTGHYRVDSEGSFTYPYLGAIEAAGKTVSQLQEHLATRLAAGYLRNPQVRVEVEEYRSRRIFVTGEVRNPNEFMMTSATMTLLQALALAGSPTQNASLEVIVSRQPTTPGGEVEIIRIDRRDLELGRAGYDLILRDGDIINVPPAEKFYVDGAVRNPGYYVLDPGLTVQQAIVLAGGLNERGSNRGIVAVRTVRGVTITVSVQLDDKVQPNDIIRVRQRFF